MKVWLSSLHTRRYPQMVIKVKTMQYDSRFHFCSEMVKEPCYAILLTF